MAILLKIRFFPPDYAKYQQLQHSKYKFHWGFLPTSYENFCENVCAFTYNHKKVMFNQTLTFDVAF